MNQNILCRVCASTDTALDLMDIFNDYETEERIADILLELAGIKATVDDGFPRNCCIQCHSDLTSAVAVRRKCIESEKLFQTPIDCSSPVIDDHADNVSMVSIKQDRIPSYHCHECVIDFYNSQSLQEHYQSKHANAIHGWKSFGISEISLFDTTDDEDEDEIAAFDLESKPKNSSTKIYYCCGCLLSFSTDIELRQHSDTIHALTAMQIDESQVFQCKTCYGLFSNAAKLKQHQNIQYVKRFQCATCGILFREPWQLNRHEFKHMPPGKFTCHICDKVFSHPDNLKGHIKTLHTNPKSQQKHVCSQCGKSFSTLPNLRVHQKLHSDEEPFACSLCGARYKLYRYLKWHMAAVHVGLYKCKECDYSFKSPSELQDHMNRHTGSRQFSCTICSSAFYTRSNLLHHLSKTHRQYRKKKV